MDPVWEEKYSAGHQQRYPWDCVVSFVFRNIPKDLRPRDISILELGFGTGANLWFAAREGYRVAGIEGSESALKSARGKFADSGYEADLRAGDFCQLPFADESFHLVIDRASLTHVGLSEQQRAVDEVYRVLKKGGKFMYNPYSSEHSSAKSGQPANDGLTINITAGSASGVGQIAFIEESFIETLFAEKWSVTCVELRQRIQKQPPTAEIHSEWLVIAQKPAIS